MMGGGVSFRKAEEGIGGKCVFFFQAEDGIRDRDVTGVQTCSSDLPPVFSFMWNLPHNLSCNPKQLDSLKAHTMNTDTRQEREYHPLSCPFPRDLARYYVR